MNSWMVAHPAIIPKTIPTISRNIPAANAISIAAIPAIIRKCKRTLFVIQRFCFGVELSFFYMQRYGFFT